MLYPSEILNKLDVSCAHRRGIYISLHAPRAFWLRKLRPQRWQVPMQLPMLPTVSVYFGVFSVVSPLPASQEPKGKESPFSRAALTVGFCSVVAEGFIWLSYCRSEMLNFSGSSLLETFQDSSQPLPSQPFPTFPLQESRHSCYSSCSKEERE